MVITLLPDGSASEQIGEFHGAGRWELEGDAVLIRWDSGWTGLLQPTARGGRELLTWKKGVARDEPPNDRQPATHLKGRAP